MPSRNHAENWVKFLRDSINMRVGSWVRIYEQNIEMRKKLEQMEQQIAALEGGRVIDMKD